MTESPHRRSALALTLRAPRCYNDRVAKPIEIVVNGRRHRVVATPDTPLLYVLRNELRLQGPRFGCGLAQCGACTVHVAGDPVRSCVMPVVAAAGKSVTTLEGLAPSYRARDGVADPERLHPVQQAFIDEQAMQCGYCSNGWIMTAAALLERLARGEPMW